MADGTTRVSPGLNDASWKAMASWLESADIDYAEVSGPGWQVGLHKESGYVARQVEPNNSPAKPLFGPGSTGISCVKVTAPVAGVFLVHHPMRSAPLMRIGARVKAGDTVALLRIGQLLVPVKAPAGGVIVRVLVSDHSTVGYGCELIELGGRQVS